MVEKRCLSVQECGELWDRDTSSSVIERGRELIPKINSKITDFERKLGKGTLVSIFIEWENPEDDRDYSVSIDGGFLRGMKKINASLVFSLIDQKQEELVHALLDDKGKLLEKSDETGEGFTFSQIRTCQRLDNTLQMIKQLEEWGGETIVFEWEESLEEQMLDGTFTGNHHSVIRRIEQPKDKVIDGLKKIAFAYVVDLREERLGEVARDILADNGLDKSSHEQKSNCFVSYAA